MSDVRQPPGPLAGPGTWGGAARPAPVEALLGGWFTAAIRGGLAFAAMAALGQAISFVVYFARGADGPVGPVAKFGWFYFGWFHHVSLIASLPDLSVADLPGAEDLVSGEASLTFQLRLALMLGTFLAIGLLYLSGRAVADRAGGGGLARGLFWGSLINSMMSGGGRSGWGGGRLGGGGFGGSFGGGGRFGGGGGGASW